VDSTTNRSGHNDAMLKPPLGVCRFDSCQKAIVVFKAVAADRKLSYRYFAMESLRSVCQI